MFIRWFNIALSNSPIGGSGNRSLVLLATDPTLQATAVLIAASSVVLAMMWTWVRARRQRLAAMPFYFVSALVLLAINLYGLFGFTGSSGGPS